MSATQQSAANSELETVLQRLDRLESLVRHIVSLLETPRPTGVVPPAGTDVEPASTPWKHLAPRPHPWRRQLYVKGRNMTVRQLVGSVKANNMTPEEAAVDLDLPVEAILEALDYAEKNRSLLDYETQYEQYLMKQRGYSLVPPAVPG